MIFEWQHPGYDILASLKQTIAEMIQANQKTVDEKTQTNLLQISQQGLLSDVAHIKRISKLEDETKRLIEELNVKNTQLEEVKKEVQEKSFEKVFKFKNQFKHISNILAEKEAEIQYLNKQVLKLKGRITSLQQDLSHSISARQSLEVSVQKVIQSIKSGFKELENTSEDMELERFVAETTLRQVTDKIQSLLNLLIDLQKTKASMETKYSKLKKEQEEKLSENIKLQIEIQKLKEQLWQQKRANSRRNENTLQMAEGEDLCFAMGQSSFCKSEVSLSVENNRIDPNRSRIERFPGIIKIEQAIQSFRADFQSTKTLQCQAKELYKKVNDENNAWHEILAVKQINAALTEEINLLKQNVNPLHQDQLLQSQHPQLHQFFTEKMNEISAFQSRLENLENCAVQAVQMIWRILYEGVTQAKTELPETQIFETEKAKLKKELNQKFQIEKQHLIQDLQSHHRQQVEAIKLKFQENQRELLRFQQKNKALLDLLEAKQNKIQNKAENKTENLLSNQPDECIKKNPQNLTQSIIKKKNCRIFYSSNNKINQNKNKISFFEQKIERMEIQLNQSNLKIQLYKEQIKRMLKTYKIKHPKMSKIRCVECFLLIDQEQNDLQKCANCKLDLHERHCLNHHLLKCKIKQNNSQRRKSKPKANKSIQKPIKINIDYF